MSEYVALNIQDMILAVGEEYVSSFLSDFHCPLNKGVENFIRKNAIDFAKKKISITYVVIKTHSGEKPEFLGVFTLTHKALAVDCVGISKTMQKKLARFASLDTGKEDYHVSAFLLAQFGKNYVFMKDQMIKGDELMELVLETLHDIQYRIGGAVLYLDCEDIEKVLNFYQSEHNNFRVFGERISETDGKKYIQMIRFF